MALLNYKSREVTYKLVYYGTGLGGKTTNLKYIHSQISEETRGELVVMPTDTDRTLFFDFMPLELGQFNGFQTRVALYTVPGQVEYNRSRQLILHSVDAIVFVADSSAERALENKESMQNMIDNLADYDLTVADVPWVLQYNKRDLVTALSFDQMEKQLNSFDVPSFEAVALEGVGVFPTLKAAMKLMIARARNVAT